MIMKISAVIERNDNNFFAITSEDVIAGCHFGGYGYSVQEAKDDFYEGIKDSLDTAREMGKEVPVKPEEIEVEFHYDLQSFFNYFDIINVSKLAKKAGINESKMRAYKSGSAFASEKTLKKILDTVHAVAAELSVVAL